MFFIIMNKTRAILGFPSTCLLVLQNDRGDHHETIPFVIETIMTWMIIIADQTATSHAFILKTNGMTLIFDCPSVFTPNMVRPLNPCAVYVWSCASHASICLLPPCCLTHALNRDSKAPSGSRVLIGVGALFLEQSIC